MDNTSTGYGMVGKNLAKTSSKIQDDTPENETSDSAIVTGAIGSAFSLVGNIVGLIKKSVAAIKKSADIHKKRKSEAYSGKEVAKESVDTAYGIAASLTSFLSSINSFYKTLKGIDSEGFLPKSYAPALGLVLSSISIIRTAISMKARNSRINKNNEVKKKLYDSKIKQEDDESYSSLTKKTNFFYRNLRYGKQKREDSKKRYKARKDFEKKLHGNSKNLSDDEKEFSLLKDLGDIEQKRLNRQKISMALDLANIASNIMTLTGAGSTARLVMSGITTGVRLGQLGMRKVKQYGRNKGWAGFNKSKSEKAKDAIYESNADKLMNKAISLNDYNDTDKSLNESYVELERQYNMIGASISDLVYTASKKGLKPVRSQIIKAMKGR